MNWSCMSLPGSFFIVLEEVEGSQRYRFVITGEAGSVAGLNIVLVAVPPKIFWKMFFFFFSCAACAVAGRGFRLLGQLDCRAAPMFSRSLELKGYRATPA